MSFSDCSFIKGCTNSTSNIICHVLCLSDEVVRFGQAGVVEDTMETATEGIYDSDESQSDDLDDDQIDSDDETQLTSM